MTMALIKRLYFCFLISLAAQPCHPDARKEIEFNHLPIHRGLSQSIVKGIMQDRRGFIWFATEDGLNKFDAYDIRVMRNDPKNDKTLSYNDITAICQDGSGIIWCGTFNGGLNGLDPVSGKITRYLAEPENEDWLASNNISSILEDKSGNNIWIGTEGGLARYDKKLGKFQTFKHHPDDPSSLSHDAILTVFIDRSGIVWVGTRNGLDRFNDKTGNFSRYGFDAVGRSGQSGDAVTAISEDHGGRLWIGTENSGLKRSDKQKEQFAAFKNNPGNKTSLSDDHIKALFTDHEGVLWIGTKYGGLDRLDPEAQESASPVFSRYQHDPFNPNSLTSDEIQSLHEDNAGTLWVGTYGGGVNFINRTKKDFLHYNNDPRNKNSLSHNIVWAIHEDDDGILWIGTHGGGLDRLDRGQNLYTHFRTAANDPNSISNDLVRVIIPDVSGHLWIGTNGGGLNYFDEKSGRFVRYMADPAHPHGLSHNEIRALYLDKAGYLWIGTHGGGLDKFDVKSGLFTQYRSDPRNPNSLGNNFIRTIYEDPDEAGKILWIGTEGGGLNRFDREKGTFRRYIFDPDHPQGLDSNYIFSIHKDKKGVLWLGTFGGGLCRFERKTGTFRSYSIAKGLPSEAVYGILEDERENLWLSTNNGLAKFNPRAETFKNYFIENGLQDNEFNGGAFFKSARGEMFFGGINGFNAFFPENIRDNPFIPPVVLTDIQLSNRSVAIGQKVDGKPFLEKSITETDKITLSHKQKVVSFSFAALNFIAPENNQYAYMLEGLDTDWNFIGNRRFVTFTTLPQGDYTFKVKGSNNDGIWNEAGISLKITVQPPFWKTNWFRVLLLLGAAVLIFGFYRWRILSIESSKRKLAGQVLERTEQINRQKNTLSATNQKMLEEIEVRRQAENKLAASLQEKELLLKEIHHRVKNNLSVVSGLLQLQANYIENKKDLEMFRESQNRIHMMALIHEKLYKSDDLARIDFGTYLKELADILIKAYDINKNDISLIFAIQDVALGIDKAIPSGLIVTELLSNTLKYAFPPSWKGEKRIVISLFPEGENGVIISVADSGVGFPAGMEIEKAETLGLKLVRLLAENQLGGRLEIDRGPGAKFSIRFRRQDTEPGL
jgi:two-component sensor histidine kinase/ligand-binding sensor domain-containing protein